MGNVLFLVLDKRILAFINNFLVFATNLIYFLSFIFKNKLALTYIICVTFLLI